MTSVLPPGLGHSACRQLRPLIVESGSPTEASVPVVLRLDDGALFSGSIRDEGSHGKIANGCEFAQMADYYLRKWVSCGKHGWILGKRKPSVYQRIKF